MKNSNKIKLFKMAHAIKSNFESFADALRHAWKVIKLYIRMKKENVNFTFRKVDGSLRKAVGTLNVSYERKTDKPSPFNVFIYWDVEADGFRSAKVENLIF